MGLCSRRSPVDPGSSPRREKPPKQGPCVAFFRTIIFTFCGFLFACHGFMTVDQYYSYPTQIRTKLNQSDVLTLPGLTLCFPIKFEGSLIAAATEVFKANFKGDGNIKCNLMKATLTRESAKLAPQSLTCQDIATPIQSINYGYGQKCYTFFSQLNKEGDRAPEDFMVRKTNEVVGGYGGDIVELEIEFPSADHYDDRNGLETRAALLMIHSPMELPNWSEKVSKIKPFMEYVVSYSKITEMLMPPPYKPGCRVYVGDGSHDPQEPVSSYDCVDHCLLRLFRLGCRCLPSNLNIRKELLYSSDKFCDDSRCHSLTNTEADNCRSLPQCSPNCVQDTFEFSSEATPMLVPSAYARPIRPGGGLGLGDIASVAQSAAKAFITLRKASAPDMTYEHSPVFNYLEFLFQVATLACVWLGISVFTFFWKPVLFLGRLLKKCLCIGK